MTKECDNCGNCVTDGFHRVFSDSDGVLHSCPGCGNSTGVIEDIKDKQGVSTR